MASFRVLPTPDLVSEFGSSLADPFLTRCGPRRHLPQWFGSEGSTRLIWIPVPRLS